MAERKANSPVVTSGADRLAVEQFARLAGKRVGLITNHTGRVGNENLVDALAAAPRVRLAAIFAPEHGVRGAVEAGASVGDARDARTGIRVRSLYGATKQPTRDMLRGLDVLVFDIQDIGTRFYTYISTMGLAMQAAAAAGLPFLVLDRPNPLGGDTVAGFVMERGLESFVGRYAIPIVHGLTVGELARMIKGERLLPGLDRLSLDVLALSGWRRDMRWPETGLPWVWTSPNIPVFESALVYPGIGLLEATEISEGRGTASPFLQLGAPWIDANSLADSLNDSDLPGVAFDAVRFTPRSIRGVAAKPRFSGRTVSGIRLRIDDVAAYLPLETGIHVLVALDAAVRRRGDPGVITSPTLLARLAGSRRLGDLLARGAAPGEIIASWRPEVAAFESARQRYFLY